MASPWKPSQAMSKSQRCWNTLRAARTHRCVDGVFCSTVWANTSQPLRRITTFCRSAMACFRFLASSNFSCRTTSCFFWSSRRIMWATSGSWYMSKARSSQGEKDSHFLGVRQDKKHQINWSIKRWRCCSVRTDTVWHALGRIKISIAMW